MNKPPVFFTLEQKRSFYDGEKHKQDSIIRGIKSQLTNFSDYVPGDSAHSAIIRLRVKINNARELRERYRAIEKRIREKISKTNRIQYGH